GRRTDFSDVTFDAYIDKHKADFNTGVTKFIRVGNDGKPNRRPNRSLIKFDFIDGLIMSGVTNASQIVKAELELYVFSSEDGGEEGLDVDIFRVMKDWNEGDTDYAAAKTGEVTWNAARHDEVEWARAGAGRVNKDREEDPDDTQFIESRGRATFRVTFNVTTTAKAIFDDAENYGWLLQAQDEGKDTYFRIYSSEHRKKRRRPKLTITAIVPSDGLAKSNLNDHGSVLRQDAPVPAIFGLSQNFPNPFNPETRIEFQLPNHSHVTIKIFNTLGQEIRTLVDAPYSSGYHSVRWDGTDRSGNQVASGVYIYKMTADDFHAVKKMSLLR
ncbi:MAG: DNRLRE domain-containing protein, partial [bacterium]